VPAPMDRPQGLAPILAAMGGTPRRWLVTGTAGFIGSHLLETLLALGEEVVSLDNFATGHRRNLDEVRAAVGEPAWRRHSFLEADIGDLPSCREACRGVDLVLHQAALGSVPRSIEDPLRTHATNATGFLNLLVAARDAGVRRFIYAASSSTYGDHPALPKVEDTIGRPLSPYAVTKYVDELYADVFGRCYGMESIGLRYFNVFGARQDPTSAYAAVIPRWVNAMLRGEPVVINGDGQTTRDFCYVKNAVQANLLAAATTNGQAVNKVYNVAYGKRTSLNALFGMLRDRLASSDPGAVVPPPVHGEFRPGDVQHSLADISRAKKLLNYQPTHDVAAGLAEAMPWYEAHCPVRSTPPPSGGTFASTPSARRQQPAPERGSPPEREVK
jgi:UDP-N-acetylglucosamine/UDP-N-acetylgalactosamine 4-epimerase